MRTGNFVAAILIILLAGQILAASETPSHDKQGRPQYGQEPDKVYFFIYILDIDDISGQNQSFTINFHLGMKWKDYRLAHPGPTPKIVPFNSIWNPGVILVNRQSRLKATLPNVVEIEPDGMVTYRQQFVGPMSQPLNLTNFPIDKQDFVIQFISTGNKLGEIEFIPYNIPGSDLIGGGMSDTFSLPDWDVLSHKASSKPFVISPKLEIPGFAFEFIAKRHFGYYFWQVVLPFMLIVCMSWAPFWVDPEKAGLQLGLASSTVLTLIAYRFLLTSMLPKLPYLTRMDYLTLSGTLLVFLAFLQVLLTSLFALNEKRRKLALKIDWISRIIFPVIFAALVAWSLLG